MVVSNVFTLYFPRKKDKTLDPVQRQLQQVEPDQQQLQQVEPDQRQLQQVEPDQQQPQQVIEQVQQLPVIVPEQGQHEENMIEPQAESDSNRQQPAQVLVEPVQEQQDNGHRDLVTGRGHIAHTSTASQAHNIMNHII